MNKKRTANTVKHMYGSFFKKNWGGRGGGQPNGFSHICELTLQKEKSLTLITKTKDHCDIVENVLKRIKIFHKTAKNNKYLYDLKS